MRRATVIYIAGITLAALPAEAATTGITYDCDTAANHFSELDLPVGNAPFVISGQVQLNALAASTSYAPIARVQVASSAAPGQSPTVYAGFSMTALPADPKNTPSGEAAVQMLDYNMYGKDDEPLPLSLLTKPGTVQPFTLSYDGSKLSVDLGGEIKVLSFKATDPVARISCSTGEFLFKNLTVESK